ncbi:MAG TPA: hypothetical protein VF290_22155 [Pyrinomonadaceae bacterium]
MNTHVVLKKLPGPNGKELKPGTEVDASEWRNALLLVEQRYLKPLDGVEAPIEASAGSRSLTEQVTGILLADLAQNGPIAQALSERGIIAIEPKQSKQRRTNVEQA